MIILGIDPGLAITGYGFVELIDGDYSIKEVGVIKTSKSLLLSQRLMKIHVGLTDLIKKYDPDEIAIEQLFFSKNTKTAIVVSQARGVLLLACVHQGKPVFEYTPLQVKQSVTGYGRANKDQVAKMVCYLLRLEEPPKPDDAADALAIAICHGNQMSYSKGETT